MYFRSISALFISLFTLLSSTAYAEKWVPISVGDITIIIPVDEAPIAVDDAFVVNEDTSGTFDILANDTDEALSGIINECDGVEFVNCIAISNIFPASISLDITNGELVFQGASNWHGQASLNYQLYDENGNSSEVALVEIGVEAINDAPTISNVSNQSTNEDITKTVSFSVADTETAVGSLSVSALSSNTTLLPASNISFSGSGTNRTVTLTPVANKNGNVTVTISVSDGNATQTDSFVLTVNSVNDAPTISNINNQTTDEDVAKAVSFTIGDTETSANSLSLSASSSNTSLLPTSNITFGGSGTNRTAMLSPAQDQFGETTVTLTVSDGSISSSDSFVLTVDPVIPILEDFELEGLQLNWNETGGTVSDQELAELTVPASNYNGITQAKEGVSGGAASYSIPVNLVPGRAGIQPNVSLNYNSQQGNGVVGVGWALNANGAISRCGMTASQDGISLAISYDETSDRLCLNGQRLVTSSPYGTNGAIYRTELDSFALVTQFGGGINDSSTYFKVKHANGTVDYYGSTVDSRHSASGRDETLTWALAKTEDSSTNNIQYSYFESTDGAGEHLLSNIYYTGFDSSIGNREVRLEYENRAKVTSSYMAGGLTRVTKRLKTISTYYNSTQVRSYELNYNMY